MSLEIPLGVEFSAATEQVNPRRYFWFQVALVMGESMITSAEGVHDLQFGPVWRYAENQTLIEGPTFDRALISRMLSSSARFQLRGLINDSVGWLLRTCEPPIVTMSTAETWLPKEALTKFEAIAGVCFEEGWRCKARYRDDVGRDHWYFERPA